MQVIQDFFKRYNLNGHAIAVGVSGGADSMALLLMLKQSFPNAQIIALTVDHQLRPTSRSEAEYVGEVAAKFGIEHHILTWEGLKPQNGIEEQARLARYDLLCNWCHQHQIQYLAIAHHLYDQAETFLMRLQRGSGVAGLSAMNEISQKNGIFLLRPFLHTSPHFLKDFLTQRGISWVEDESNQCTDFLRVKMRQFLSILESHTGITPERLALTADNLRQTRSFIESMVNETAHKHFHFWHNAGCSCDFTLFLSLHSELQYYVLTHLITRFGENTYTPEAASLHIILEQLRQPLFESATLGGCHIQKKDLRLWIIKEKRQVETPYSIQLWEDFVRQTPEVRGIKLPHKLKIALLDEKLSQK